MWRRLLCSVILAHACCEGWAASGNADSYPSKPIRLIDGFAAGGSADYIARGVGPVLAERLGQSVIVDNRPGAGGNVGAQIVARALADGNTLMMGSITALSSSRSLYPKLGYDLLKDFSFVSQVATAANVLVANPSLPVKSVSDLVAVARSAPKTLRYGSAGVASPGHLFMELLDKLSGMELIHVPYKGGG